jgi:hypothetical protein
MKHSGTSMVGSDSVSSMVDFVIMVGFIMVGYFY